MEIKLIEGSNNCKVCEDGTVIGVKGKPLKPGIGTTGYKIVSISYRDRGLVTKPVHRLVAEAFVPKIEGMNIINHKDGDKFNNAASNLEWTDYKGNLHHAFDNGLNVLRHGEQSNFATYSENQIREICEMLVKDFRDKEISDTLNIPPKLINQIRTKTNWVRISDEYDFRQTRVRSLTDDQAHQVCKLLERGTLPTTILKQLGITTATRSVIKLIRSRKIYKDISQNYNF